MLNQQLFKVNIEEYFFNNHSILRVLTFDQYISVRSYVHFAYYNCWIILYPNTQNLWKFKKLTNIN